MKTTPVKIQLKHTHSLSMFGYSLKDTDTERRRTALLYAAQYWGPVYVIRKLNVLAIYRKRQQITMGKRARADMKFIQRLLKKTD